MRAEPRVAAQRDTVDAGGALAVYDGYAYFPMFDHAVRRASLAGGESELFVETGPQPGRIAVDASGIYVGAIWQMQHAPLCPSVAGTLHRTCAGPNVVRVDETSAYWTEWDVMKIAK